MTLEEWHKEGTLKFGSDFLDWVFVCPICKKKMSVRDYKEAKAPEEAVAFSCVGRWNKEQGCNYAGDGLLQYNPIDVDGTKVFDFAIVYCEYPSINNPKLY